MSIYLKHTEPLPAKGFYKENRALSLIVFNLVCATVMISALLVLWNSRGREEAAWYLLVPVFNRQC